MDKTFDELLARLDEAAGRIFGPGVFADAAAAIRELRAAALAEGGAREPVAWQRRIKFSDVPGAIPKWEQCGQGEATSHFDRSPYHEYRALYAAPIAPPPAVPADGATTQNPYQQFAEGNHSIGIIKDGKLIATDEQVYAAPAAPPAPDEDGERAALQATIDRLMLEFCPDEMTPEQVKRWADCQVPASIEQTASVEAALAPAQSGRGEPASPLLPGLEWCLNECSDNEDAADDAGNKQAAKAHALDAEIIRAEISRIKGEGSGS